MTVPFTGGQPWLIGGRTARLDFWGMPRTPGDPSIIAGTITEVDGQGDVVLDVFIGPKGDPGNPLPPWRIEWDSTIVNVGDLPAVAGLDESDDGRAWVIGTHLYVYVHELGGYRSIDAGIQGPQGITPNIDASAELVVTTDPDDLVVPVTESGVSTHPNFKFHIPTAPLIGPPGPSTNIRGAPDYDNTIPPQDGQGVVWNDEKEKFEPGDLSPTSATMYTIPQSNFVAYSGSAGRQLIASLDVDALLYAWYPDVTGSVVIQRNFLSSAQVEVEVRIGDTGVGTGETAPLCGIGPFDPSWALLDSAAVANISPHFSDDANPSRAVSPGTAAGRVPAGQAKTIYVFLHKIGGTGTYAMPDSGVNQLRLLQFPVS
jgi:hypothetical protein